MNTEFINPVEVIKSLQSKTEYIRNLCVLAHVDHGKTSLVDSLICSNHIIHPSQAGMVRIMDDRLDEQERHITMKSSAISLTYTSRTNNLYLVNLIDSPGHVDFSGEIFSALKLITELKLTPLDAYIHLNDLLQTVNSLIGSLIVRDLNIESETTQNNKEGRSDSIDGKEIDLDTLIEEKEQQLYFRPENGNVIFASATDCWAFTLESFAVILSDKIGFKKEIIQKLLWGEYYYDPKTKKVFSSIEGLSSKSSGKPMFVEFVLQNIYKLYEIVANEKSLAKINSIISKLNLKVDLKNDNDNYDWKLMIKKIMREWLPIPSTVFECVIKVIPNPLIANINKLDVLFPKHKVNATTFPEVEELKNKLKTGDPNIVESQTFSFISKMFPVTKKSILDMEIMGDDDKNDVVFMPFCRNYSGTIKKGKSYFVIGPKHDPKANAYDINKIRFDNLYIFVKQCLEPVDEIFPGNIFSIGNLHNNVFKTATISSFFNFPAVVPTNINKNSIMKVSILPLDLKDLDALIKGLERLNKSDPSADYYVQENGEHILVTAGEIHLERCIKDLEDNLAKVKFKVSEPIVNFKEGLLNTNYKVDKILKDKNTKNKKKEYEQALEKSKKRIKTGYEAYGGDEEDQDDDERYGFYYVDTKENLEKKKTKYENLSKSEKTERKKVNVEELKNKGEKTNFYIKKTTHLKEEENIIKGYSKSSTPDNNCQIAITAIGMTQEVLKLLENNEKLLSEVDNYKYIVSGEIYKRIQHFKEELIDKTPNKKLKTLFQNSLFCFGPNNCGQNMLIIKNLPPKFNYFDKIINLDDDGLTPKQSYDGPTFNIIDKNDPYLKSSVTPTKNSGKKSFFNGEVEEEVIDTNSKSKKEKLLHSSEKTKKDRTTDIFVENKVIDSHSVSTTLEYEINNKLKDLSVSEFFNSIKSGFEFSLANGPLCKESLYGVIFIVEEIVILEPEKPEKKKKNVVVETKPQVEEEFNPLDVMLLESSEGNNEINEINKQNEKNEKLSKENTEGTNNKETIDSDKDKNTENIDTTNKVNAENNLRSLESLDLKKDVNLGSTENLKYNNENKADLLVSAESLKNTSKMSASEDSHERKRLLKFGPITGQIMGTVKDCCRKSCMNSDPRLIEAMYLCMFQIKNEHIGKIYSVISRRRGKIIKESSSDDGLYCTLETNIPVAESFGFVNEIRNKSSGLANPMLEFSHWEMIEDDPFYIPTTVEEIENEGLLNVKPNIAKMYINKARIRKGLPIDDQVVKHGDKQRTLKNKK